MRSRAGLLSLGLAALGSGALLVPVAHSAAEQSSERIGRELAAAFAVPVRPEPAPLFANAPVARVSDADRASSDKAEKSDAAKAKKAPAKKGAKQAKAAERRGAPDLFVSAATVRSWVGRPVTPSASFVKAQGKRPAGLRLQGTSALGIGVRDGDVLTHAGGRPVASPNDVVAAVIASHARGERVVTGTLWRGSDEYRLTVELPR